jgi:hypothetical protein
MGVKVVSGLLGSRETGMWMDGDVTGTDRERDRDGIMI